MRQPGIANDPQNGLQLPQADANFMSVNPPSLREPSAPRRVTKSQPVSIVNRVNQGPPAAPPPRGVKSSHNSVAFNAPPLPAPVKPPFVPGKPSKESIEQFIKSNNVRPPSPHLMKPPKTVEAPPKIENVIIAEKSENFMPVAEVDSTETLSVHVQSERLETRPQLEKLDDRPAQSERLEIRNPTTIPPVPRRRINTRAQAPVPLVSDRNISMGLEKVQPSEKVSEKIQFRSLTAPIQPKQSKSKDLDHEVNAVVERMASYSVPSTLKKSTSRELLKDIKNSAIKLQSEVVLEQKKDAPAPPLLPPPEVTTVQVSFWGFPAKHVLVNLKAIHCTTSTRIQQFKETIIKKYFSPVQDPAGWQLGVGNLLDENYEIIDETKLVFDVLQNMTSSLNMFLIRQRPTLFQVNFYTDYGEILKIPHISPYTTIDEVIAHVCADTKKHEQTTISIVNLNENDESRIGASDETPFDAMNVQTMKFLIQRHFRKPPRPIQSFVTLYLDGDYKRTIWLKSNNIQVKELILQFLKPYNVSTLDSIVLDLTVCAKSREAVKMFESNDFISPLDFSSAFKIYIAHKSSKSIVKISYLESLVVETTPEGAITSASSLNGAGSIPNLLKRMTQQELEQQSAKIAEILKNEEVLEESVRSASATADSDKMHEEMIQRKLSKLSVIFGIPNDTNLVRTVANSEKLSQLIRDGIPGNEKSLQKLSKLLGVQQNQLRPREGSLQIVKRDFDSDNDTVKIYFMNQTFKNIKITPEMTAQEVIEFLIEKLNINDDISNYSLFEDKRTGQSIISPEENLHELMRSWTGNEILVFKRVSESSPRVTIAPSILSNSKSKQNVHQRRAAKVANILGLNEKKNFLDQSSNDVKEIVELLGKSEEESNNGSNGTGMQGSHSVTEFFEEIQIAHEGWLKLIQSEETNTAEQFWCSIENGVFYGTTFQQQQKMMNAADPYKERSEHSIQITLEKMIAIRSMRHRTRIEIREERPDGSHGKYIFEAETIDDCSNWLKHLQTRSFKPEKAPVAPHRVTMDDFTIFKVLGRGKFGKVLLCLEKATQNLYAIKVIQKSSVQNTRQLRNNQRENQLLRAIRHPFIISLHYAFQTPERLYLVMEYVNGGELYFHIMNFGRFSEERVRFYGAEIFLALQCLHGKGIVYRDLKLENILLDRDGHVKITDFGLCRPVDDYTEEDLEVIAGTLEYLAPELLTREQIGQNFQTDWWSYGCVLYEMLVGIHPFYEPERRDIGKRIKTAKFTIPEFASAEIKDLIQGMLARNPVKRICYGPKGAQRIQQHAFFASIDFQKLFDKKIEPPFKPDVVDDLDVRYFDNEFTSEPAVLTPIQDQILNTTQPPQYSFSGYSFMG